MGNKHEERRKEWMRRLRGEHTGSDRDVVHAVDDAASLRSDATAAVGAALGTGWYEEPGSGVDAAVVMLCRLRRAAAGEKRASEGGDAAVRRALEEADAEAVLWVASRMVSYLDESGFPEALEPWLPRRELT
jgi:hypothetical protein